MPDGLGIALLVFPALIAWSVAITKVASRQAKVMARPMSRVNRHIATLLAWSWLLVIPFDRTTIVWLSWALPGLAPLTATLYLAVEIAIRTRSPGS